MSHSSLLLDTPVVLWFIDNDPRLGPKGYHLIEEALEVYVSAASMWEIAIKVSAGKMRIPPNLATILEESGFLQLDVSFDHAQKVTDLSPHHADLFDRLLLAQALVEGLGLVSADAVLAKYGSPVVPI